MLGEYEVAASWLEKVIARSPDNGVKEDILKLEELRQKAGLTTKDEE